MAREKDETEVQEPEEKKPAAAAEEEEEISLEEDDGGDERDEDDGDGEPEPEPERRKTRKEKRSERGAIIKQLAEKDRELAEYRERLARIEGQLQERGTRDKVEDKDPIDAKLEDVKRRAQQVVETYNALKAANALAPERHAELQREAERLEDEKTDLLVEKRIKAREKPADPRQEAQRRTIDALRARHPDVVSDQKAFNYALTIHRARVLREGPSADTMEAFDEAAEQARDDLGLRPSVRPSKNTRASYASTPRSMGGGSGEIPKSWKPTDMDRKMAAERFGHIKDERERMRQYGLKVIKPALLRQAKEKRA